MVAPRSKLFLIILGGLAFFGILALYILFNPSEIALFPKCPLYSNLGIYCPGCGSQRAVHQLLNGNIINGFRHNYLILLLIAVLVYETYIYFINTVFKKDKSNLLHNSKVTFGILFLVVSFWILRNIDYYPFTELAP